MQSRIHILAQALRSSRPQARALWSATPGFAPLLCRRCAAGKFSTSAVRGVARAAQGAGSKGYPSQLVIYEAGEMRTSFVAFWKATAMFQFGVVAVFLAPLLYWNEKQPDGRVRLGQAVGLTLAGGIPMALMSYLTTPFTKRITLSLPASARHNLHTLHKFSASLPADTRLEFTTLRAFPIERKTGVFLFEMQALKSQWWRFANIERAKTEEWRKRWKTKSFAQKLAAWINEPRFKFYVKEGRAYTVKTGVPGVWENVARRIKAQTEAPAGAESLMEGSTKSRPPGQAGVRSAGRPAMGAGARVLPAIPQIKSVIEERKAKSLRRQTARSTRPTSSRGDL